MITTTEATWDIRCGDCLTELPRLDDSPRLVAADPPYNIGVDYGDGKKADSLPVDEYRQWCHEWLRLCRDALTDDGSLWVVCPDEHVAYFAMFLDGLGMHQRNWIVWHETFGVNCSHKFSRCKRHVLYYVKNERRFVFNADDVRVPSDRQLKYGDKRANPKGKVPGDVWEISRVCGTFNERLSEFPAQLPLELLRRIVAVASEPRDLVVDPFSGSGTTGVAAVESGRRYVGIEKNPRFAELSKRRLENCQRLMF